MPRNVVSRNNDLISKLAYIHNVKCRNTLSQKIHVFDQNLNSRKINQKKSKKSKTRTILREVILLVLSGFYWIESNLLPSVIGTTFLPHGYHRNPSCFLGVSKRPHLALNYMLRKHSVSFCTVSKLWFFSNFTYYLGRLSRNQSVSSIGEKRVGLNIQSKVSLSRPKTMPKHFLNN